MEERNVGTKVISLNQGLISVKDLKLMIREIRDSSYQNS